MSSQIEQVFMITGGAGFIGSNFVRYVLDHEPDARITNLDAMTYAGVPATVAELNEYSGHSFVEGDIRDAALVDEIMPGHDLVVHFAAESHVDRSISGPSVFLETNVVGTGVMIDAAYRHGIGRFVHVSTDEVYGSIDHGFAPETAPLDPSSPYSSSKAGSDLLALSYGTTYGYDVVVTRCTNNYGPYQFPEKMLPLFITNLSEGSKVPLYGDGLNERDWLFVEDHCLAIRRVLESGTPGEVYNIGGDCERTNLEIVDAICSTVDRLRPGLPHAPCSSLVTFVRDRPGHDRRYAIDATKIHEQLGWQPSVDFEQGLERTVAWYLDQTDWIDRVTSGKYRRERLGLTGEQGPS